jgi:hypothetical protein
MLMKALKGTLDLGKHGGVDVVSANEIAKIQKCCETFDDLWWHKSLNGGEIYLREVRPRSHIHTREMNAPSLTPSSHLQSTA